MEFDSDSARRETPLHLCRSVECGDILIAASEQESYQRTAPLIYGPRAEWMKQVVAEKTRETVTPPQFHIVQFKDATVHGPGPITLANNILVEETLLNCQDDTVLGNINLNHELKQYYLVNRTEIKSVPGIFIHLLVQWDGNYGHWLVECVPRLMLLMKSIPKVGQKILVSGNGGPIDQVYTDSLSYLGFDKEDIFFTRFDTLKFETIVYPTPLTVQPWVKSPSVVLELEELGRRVVGREMPGQAERVFIERPNTSRRMLLNQDSIKAELMKHGFAVVNPSKMTFSEQVIAFSGAKIIVGVLGAECTNLVFARHGLTFIGLCPEHMQDDFFWDLVSHKNGSYVSLHGTSKKPSEGMNSPFEIDLEILRKLIAEADK